MRTLLFLCFWVIQISTTYAQTSAEICNNDLDDDGDGLIDCYDMADCPCASDHDCTLEQTRMPLELGLLWKSPGDYNAACTPIVGNLNPWSDSIPEVIVGTYFNSNTQGVSIVKGDGSNWNSPDFIDLGFASNSQFLNPAIADLDGNAVPELFMVCGDNKIRVYTNYTPGTNPAMQLWATSVDTCQSSKSYAYSADFDGDGISEIYAGNEVFGFDLSNPGAPVLKRLLRGVGPTGLITLRFNSTIAADLLSPADCNGDPDCDGLEIAAGYGIYSVDIDPNDGDGMQIKLQRNINASSGQGFTDGFTCVADLNHDGIQEVIVPGFRNQIIGIYVWNRTGFWRFLPLNLSYSNFLPDPGACSVGNVFDDRTMGFAEDWPEILIRYGSNMRALNLHALTLNPAAPYWWANNILLNDDQSGHGVMSSYDFDNNGLSEIIVADEGNLYILYGGSAPFPPGVSTQRVISSYPTNAITADEIPVVADLDGDGNPEILTYDLDFVQQLTNLQAVHPKNPDYSRWLPARNIWNQYAYHVVNINDDLTVPKVQQAGYLEMPAPGSGKRPFNNFLAQRPAYFHPDATPYFPSADLQVKVTEVICQLPTFQVKLEICNLGDAPSADSTKIRFYRAGDPFSAPASNSIGTFLLSTQSIPPDSCIQYTAILPNAFGNIYAVLNDWGNHSVPLPTGDTAFYRQECNLQNNVAIFKMDLSNGLPVSLGPDQVICSGETISLNATPGFTSYLWQNGATTASILVGIPGTYWVQTKDLCFNTRRDTMELFLGDDFQSIQAVACEGEFFSYGGQNIAAGSSQSFVFTNTFGCDSTIFVQVALLPKDTTTEVRNICPGDSTLVFGSFVSTPGTFSQVLQNFNGCDSIHAVTVALFPTPVPSTEIRQICPGDSTLVFGNFVKTAGVFSQNFSNTTGCDSIHSVTVSLFPASVPTNEMRQICPGDSTLVFGSFVKNAGVFSQNFPNSNGCDSTHSVTVSLLPAPTPTNETRQICPGDSTLVFGSFVKIAGVFSQHFPSATGCDSIHSVTVSLFPAPVPTNEMRQICPGDSTLVFGSFVKIAGVFSQNFPNANGCDSTHNVTVSLFPVPIPTNELRQICPGDSTFVFGNFVQTAGVFSQIFSNATGCDSTHSVTVSLFPAPTPTNESRQICPGDSILVFGSFVKTAGVFSQNFPNANGCDSTHSVTVNLFPAPTPTSESRQICPGDSTLVFGNFVQTAGVFSQSFPNANGCDSTHSVTVSLFPAPTPTNETRQICPGDSTLVFGNFVQTAGVFSQSFPNANGCDSTHSVTVSLFPAPTPTNESRQICPGDSTLVFGNFVQTAGLFSQSFPNANGCDSTHNVTVSLFPAPAPTNEIRQICPGDSTLVFGNFVQTAGVFSQSFPNATGCDSTHSVMVSLFPAPLPTSELRQICPGDSTLVFGSYVQSTGLYTQSFPNANGCDSLHSIEVEEVSRYELADSVALCPGDSVLLFGHWVLQPTVIQELVPGVIGCDTLWTIEVQGIVPPVISLQITQPNAQQTTGKVEVFGGNGSLFSLDGLQFSTQTVFEQLAAGTYTPCTRSLRAVCINRLL